MERDILSRDLFRLRSSRRDTRVSPQPKTIYDAIVVGSGANGGWAAKKLSEAGLKVVILEAGRKVSPSEFTEHMPAYQLLVPELFSRIGSHPTHPEGLLRLY